MNLFRYKGFKSLAEVDRITIPEYVLLMEAVQLEQVDLDYRNHLQAYLNFAVKATKNGKKPKPVFDKFNKFFDYEKEVDKVKKRGKQESRFGEGIGKFFRKEK